jgi:hypothetical protein
MHRLMVSENATQNPSATMAWEAVHSAVSLLTSAVLASDTVEGFHEYMGLDGGPDTLGLDQSECVRLFNVQKAFDVAQSHILADGDGCGRRLILKYFKDVLGNTSLTHGLAMLIGGTTPDVDRTPAGLGVVYAFSPIWQQPPSRS